MPGLQFLRACWAADAVIRAEPRKSCPDASYCPALEQPSTPLRQHSPVAHGNASDAIHETPLAVTDTLCGAATHLSSGSPRLCTPRYSQGCNSFISSSSLQGSPQAVMPPTSTPCISATAMPTPSTSPAPAAQPAAPERGPTLASAWAQIQKDRQVQSGPAAELQYLAIQLTAPESLSAPLSQPRSPGSRQVGQLLALSLGRAMSLSASYTNSSVLAPVPEDSQLDGVLPVRPIARHDRSVSLPAKWAGMHGSGRSAGSAIAGTPHRACMHSGAPKRGQPPRSVRRLSSPQAAPMQEQQAVQGAMVKAALHSALQRHCPVGEDAADNLLSSLAANI